jgi:hypothetical protein
MTNETNSADTLSYDDFDKPKLPQTLNILTILTFIGCSIFLIFSLASPWLISFSKKMMERASASGEELTAREAEKIRLAQQNMELAEVNMIPLMVIGIAGIILCFVGALMMRKLKKDGFWIYVAGQLIPILGTFFIMGAAQYKEIGNIVMLAFPIIFIILYATQRKYLVN